MRNNNLWINLNDNSKHKSDFTGLEVSMVLCSFMALATEREFFVTMHIFVGWALSTSTIIIIKIIITGLTISIVIIATIIFNIIIIVVCNHKCSYRMDMWQQTTMMPRAQDWQDCKIFGHVETKTTHTQDNSYSMQPTPRANFTQYNLCDKSYSIQLIPRANRTQYNHTQGESYLKSYCSEI